MLESFVGRRAHLLVLEPMPEAERLEVVVLVDIDAVLDRIDGNSGGLQLRGEFLRVVDAGERADELMDCRLVLDANGPSRKTLVGATRAGRGQHRTPLIVAGHGDRDPSLVT